MNISKSADRPYGNENEPVGLRALVLFHPIGRFGMDRLTQLMEAAKKRWDWRIDAICVANDEDAFKKLFSPDGEVFAFPRMLNIAPWESDPAQVADVDQRLWQAELRTKIPVGRVIAAAPASIGRGYVVAARDRLKSPLADRVLGDNTEPAKIVRRLFAFADDVIETCKPDVLIATEWGTALQYPVWLAAAGRGIPCLAIRRSKILSGQEYWTTDPLMLNPAAASDAAARREAGAAVSDEAKAYIQSFREQPAMSNYVENKWQLTGNPWRLRPYKWIMLPVLLARGVAIDVMYRLRRLDRELRASAFERVWAPYSRIVGGYRHRRFLRTYDDPALAEMKYVYFPIHKETDQPLTFQATPWQDQRNTIQVLASCLPAGYQLLVREHRLNFGQRPKDYYRNLSRLPNVVLIDAFDSQFKYLKHADLIVTENGSSGWEGLLLRRRVLTVAPNFYDGAGLSVMAHNPNELSTKVVEALARPAVSDPATHDRHLGYMTDAERATAFPEQDIPAALDRLAVVLGDQWGARPNTSQANIAQSAAE
ncbi:MAG: hypothetical protein P8Y71_01925 [Pseudolabrys sp.]|jgi:hypothetical protein